MTTEVVYCRKRVYGGSWGGHQCSRKAKRDGYCTQHHPDTVAKRQKETDRRYKEKQARSPWVLLRKANEEIKALVEETRVLRAQLNEQEDIAGKDGARHFDTECEQQEPSGE